MLISARYIPPDDGHLLDAGRRTYRKARETAAQVLKSARRSRSHHIQHGFKTGCAQGYEEGFQKGLKAAQADALKSHAALVSSIKDARDDCISLLFELAGEIFGAGAALQHELVTAKIQSLLDGMLKHRPLVIQVSPLQADSVRREIESHLKEPNIRVEAHERITPGNARIITETGNIELDWESHLNLLKESYAGGYTAHSER